jgi:hypothetical protein
MEKLLRERNLILPLYADSSARIAYRDVTSAESKLFPLLRRVQKQISQFSEDPLP